MPINLAKEWMGHEDISTTSKIYTHKSKKAFEDAFVLYDKFLNPDEDDATVMQHQMSANSNK